MIPNERHDYVSLLLDEKLTHMSPTHFECCIYKVPEWLRRQNEKAYEPQMMAIGPYHRGKGNLRVMEEHKLRYLQQLLERREETSVDRYIKAMRDLQERGRSSYTDDVSLNEDEFVEMMLLDSCFIVELFRKFTITSMRDTHDILFKMDWILHIIWCDLMLFENQLPFFVLVQFFNMTRVPDPQDDFVDLVMRYNYWIRHHYFYSELPVPGWVLNASSKVLTHDLKHFLALVHHMTFSSLAKLMSQKNVGDEKKRWENIRCATELHEAGIKFTMAQPETSLNIKFENGVLEIPLFVVHEKMECLFRNLIAHEQHLQDTNPKYASDYLTFLCCLINSSKDVSLLRRCGILNNKLGDDEAVSTVFSNTYACLFASRNGFCYAQVFNDINAHCRRRSNIWTAKLRRDYFNSPWTIISFLGVVFLLLLTLMQTVISILPYLTHRLLS